MVSHKRQNFNLRRDLPGLAISITLHVVAFALMAMVRLAANPHETLIAIETLFSDENQTPEEFTKELDQQETIAETLNFVAGGVTASKIGGSEVPVVAQQKIEQSINTTPKIAVNIGAVTLPGIESLGHDLGAGQVTGEVGAIVDGYGAALDRITQELIRLMREQKVLVVWLFDESESMKDDQADLKTRIHRIYEELKLVDDASKDDVLLTSIVSFGQKLTYQLPQKKPTRDNQQIMRAIDQISIDRTGIENTCAAIITTINEYRRFVVQGKRKLVLVVVSDESGDDGELVEDALHLAKSTNTSIYVMGRESVFGNPYAYQRYRHPDTGNWHLLPIRRGPETPFAEQLQIDGLRRRYDAAMSGFGPYEQVRLARDTGGIFFMLPHEEQDLNSYVDRKFAALDMKEYVPDIGSRRDYAATRDRSEFRRTIWEVILALSPYDPKNKELEVPVHDYSIVPAQYAQPLATTMARCMNLFSVMNEAQRRLDSVRKLRDKEPSRRWRANYDLILGQIMAYRVRLFQYMVGLNQFGKTLPKRKLDPKSNYWRVNIGGTNLLKPDDEQVKLTKVSLADMEQARDAANNQFKLVQKEHPNTPWALRAAWELTRGFGASFAEGHYDPPPPRPKGAPAPRPLPNL